MAQQNWTRDELLIAFNLYCRTPFGRLHRGNPDIIGLSQEIGRTPNAVAMKLCNFASFDPVQQARNIKGLSNTSRADAKIWDDFNANTEQFAFESQEAAARLLQGVAQEAEVSEEELVLPSGPTEATRTVRTRLVQSFFRVSVLTSYDYQCAMCGLNLSELLTASHIIPWSKNVERRADPRNGLALCALHDRAFDRGLLCVESSLQIVLSSRLKVQTSNRIHTVALLELEGQKIMTPKRFAPDPVALAFHREHIFKST